MKSSHVVGLAVTLMIGTGGLVYAITPNGGFSSGAPAGQQQAADAAEGPAPSGSAEAEEAAGAKPRNPALFVDEKTVRVEARLGNRETSKDGAETYVMLELKGSDAAAPAATTAVHLGLVIDKSGSMRGKRFENAKASAKAAIDRLVDGDTVSVVAFDTKTEPVVAAGRVDGTTREALKRSVDAIALGGDTCISCGIDAMAALMAQTPGLTRRMIVLSDGDATAGVRDVEEMRSVARRARTAGVTVSGIGVDLQYNERLMAAIAEGGEGQHRFVAQPSDLIAVFESEAASLRQTVAENVEARVRLASGVELIEVMDRPFSRSGSELVVALGSLTKGEVKTVLCRVRVPASAAAELPVADVSVRFNDLTSAGNAVVESKGALASQPAREQGDPDPFVLARVERSETARALDEANRLFRAGKPEAARTRIEARRDKLKSKGGVFKPSSPQDPFGGRSSDAKKDVDKQIDTLDRASTGFAQPPAAPKPSPTTGAAPKRPMVAADPFESNARKNQEDAFNSTR